MSTLRNLWTALNELHRIAKADISNAASTLKTHPNIESQRQTIKNKIIYKTLTPKFSLVFVNIRGAVSFATIRTENYLFLHLVQ